MRQPRGSGSRTRIAGLLAAIVAVLLAFGASPAMAATGTPVLLQPEEFTEYGAAIPIKYELPQDAAAGTVKLEFEGVGGPSNVTLTLAAAEGTAGKHELTLNAHKLTPNPAVASTTSPEIADGEYNVILTYENSAKEGQSAPAEVEEILIKTVTRAPTLTAPLSSSSHSSPLLVSYTLPEESGPEGAKIELTPTKGGATIVATLEVEEGREGLHAVELNLHDLEASPGVEKSSAETVPDGEYDVTVSYEDELGNPRAHATATGVKLKTATAPPTLVKPAAASTFSNAVPIEIEYTLPEAAASGSVKLVFAPTSGPVVTLTMTAAASTAGTHKFTINPHEPGAGAVNVASVEGASSIADGKYAVTLQYQDALLNPAASATSGGVTIKTLTSPPSLVSPVSGQAFFTPFEVSYSLPEAALAGSVRLVFVGAHVGVKTLTLTNAAGGTHSIEVKPSNPASAAGVASGPAELPADEYELRVSYQDTLGNPAGTSAAATIRITNGPPCQVGTYSTTGETPCTEAPLGYFVASQGATHATECSAGYYAPEKGMSLCLPAAPGSFVEGAAATRQRPCPAGSFAGATATIKCTPTPKNTYATGGAIAPTPCPSGSASAEGASACVAISTGGSGFPSEKTKPSGPVGTVTEIAPALSVKVSSAKRPGSLLMKRRQRYVLRCSAAGKVSVQVSAVLKEGKTAMTVKAATATVSCAAGKPVEPTAVFKLAQAAKTLLHGSGASVRLTVKVFGTGAGAHSKLAAAVVRGGR